MFYLITNNKCEQGFILSIVLFFLFIMSLLILSSLNTANLALHISRNRLLASQQFQAAEIGLKVAEDKLNVEKLNILTLQGQFKFAGFQVSYDIKRYRPSFCNNQKLTYIYRIISQAKQIEGKLLTLETTYAINSNETCHGGESKLTSIGRSTWRELKNPFH